GAAGESSCAVALDCWLIMAAAMMPPTKANPSAKQIVCNSDRIMEVSYVGGRRNVVSKHNMMMKRLSAPRPSETFSNVHSRAFCTARFANAARGDRAIHLRHARVGRGQRIDSESSAIAS